MNALGDKRWYDMPGQIVFLTTKWMNGSKKSRILKTFERFAAFVVVSVLRKELYVKLLLIHKSRRRFSLFRRTAFDYN